MYNLPSDVGQFGLLRGPNKPPFPACTVAAPYTFKLVTTTTPQTGSFLVPQGTNQGLSAEYVFVLKAVPADPNTLWLTHPLKVSWGIAQPDITTSDYVPVGACNYAPADFTQLSASDLAGVTPNIPNAPPFNQPPIYQNANYPQYQPGMPYLICAAGTGLCAGRH